MSTGPAPTPITALTRRGVLGLGSAVALATVITGCTSSPPVHVAPTDHISRVGDAATLLQLLPPGLVLADQSALITPGAGVQLDFSLALPRIDAGVAALLDPSGLAPGAVEAAPGHEFLIVALTATPPFFLDWNTPDLQFEAGTVRQRVSWPFGLWSEGRTAYERPRVAYVISVPVGSQVWLVISDSGRDGRIELRSGRRGQDVGTLSHQPFLGGLEVVVPPDGFTHPLSVRTTPTDDQLADSFDCRFEFEFDPQWSFRSPVLPSREWVADDDHLWLWIGFSRLALVLDGVGLSLITTPARMFELIIAGESLRPVRVETDRIHRPDETLVLDNSGDHQPSVVFQIPSTTSRVALEIDVNSALEVEYADGSVPARWSETVSPFQLNLTLPF